MTDYYTINPDLIIYALLKTDHSFSIHQKRGAILFVGKGIDERNAKKQIKEKLQEFSSK